MNTIDHGDQSSFVAGRELADVVRDVHWAKIDEFFDRIATEAWLAAMARQDDGGAPIPKPSRGAAGNRARFDADQRMDVRARALRRARARPAGVRASGEIDLFSARSRPSWRRRGGAWVAEALPCSVTESPRPPSSSL